jgi:cytochrome c oxidase assembly protein subunit 15
MKTSLRFTAAATIGVYLLIFIGGLVRVSGAGLGCPDWPKCFGRWIPPLSVNQLPTNIDPAEFNITLAWIEYVNRLCGVVVGLLVAISVLLVIKNFRKHPVILWSSVVALLLLLYTAWQGSQVVASELDPTIVSAHMFFAFLIANLLTIATQRIYYVVNPDAEKGSVFPGGLRTWILIAWGFGLLQALLGAQVRGTIEAIAKALPLATEAEWVANLQPVNHLHIGLGFFLFALSLNVGIRTLREGQNLSSGAWQAAWAVLILSIGQIILGLLMLFGGVKPLAELLHLWSATLLIGCLLVLQTSICQAQKG